MNLEQLEKTVAYLKAIVETRREKLIQAETDLEKAWQEYLAAGGTTL